MNVQLRDLSYVSTTSFVSSASYWMPEVMTPSAWLEHAPFGFWMIGALRPRTVVELGVHHGFSYFAFCQAVQRLHLDARCFGIDTWRGDEHAGFYGDEVYETVCGHNRRYDGFSRLIRSDFGDACAQFANGSIDLLHIDGCHTYEAVRRDFESWLPKMSQRGVVLFHDTAEYGNGFGVHVLWEELRRQYPHFEFRHGHGLGVLGVGAHIPAKVRELMHASAGVAAAQAVRAEYSRLGSYVDVQQRVAAQDEQIARLTAHVRGLEARVESYEASTSWRVTAPLRAVVGAVHRAKGRAAHLGETARDAVAGEIPNEPALRTDR